MPIHRREFEPDAQGPLKGVQVIDMSRLIAGNTLTMVLADYGAEVVKIELPKGDPLRDWKTSGVETYWKTLARNKKSLCLDMRRPEAVEIVKDLVKQADVFVEGFRPGSLETMGLAPEILLELNPKLVVVRISGFGQSGPYRDRPGFGALVEGMTGFAASIGYADREPLMPNFPLADSFAAYAGVGAVLVALRHIETAGGQGQVIDLPLLEPMFGVLGPQAAAYRLTNKVRQRSGNRSMLTAPRGAYRCKDGRYVAVSTAIQSMAERLFHAIGRPDLVTDPRYSTFEKRAAHADELDAIMQEFLNTLTQEEAVAHFTAVDVTVGPIYDISQIIEDDHFIEREVLVEVEDDDMGSVPISGLPVRLSETPMHLYRPAPKKGADRNEVLGWIGMSEDEAEKLTKAGIVIAPR